MFCIYETQGPEVPKNCVGKLHTFEDAKEHVKNTRKLILLEDDLMFHGCADYFTEDGICGQIEPEDLWPDPSKYRRTK